MIIINSDDFGFSPEINKATYIAFKEGLISSTTTLVNFEEGFIDALKYIKEDKLDKKAIGIHLNLTEGIPLTEKIKKNPRFCVDGKFINKRSSATAFKLDAFSKECVYEEIEAQLKRFISKFGFIPSHIDSHHHIHTEFSITKCILDLAKKYKIKCIRLARNTGEKNDIKRAIYRGLLNGYMRLRGARGTDKFGGVEDIIFSGIKPNVNYEIMVHAILPLNEEKLVDLDNLDLRGKLVKLFKGENWQISNYTDLIN